jgi:hypothetical protein
MRFLLLASTIIFTLESSLQHFKNILIDKQKKQQQKQSNECLFVPFLIPTSP